MSYLRITHNHTNPFRIYQYILVLLSSPGSSSTSSLNSMDDFMTSSNSFFAHSGAFSFSYQPSCGLLSSNQPSFTNLGSAIIRITFLCLDYIIRVEIFKCRSKSPSVVILCGQGRSLNKEALNQVLQEQIQCFFCFDSCIYYSILNKKIQHLVVSFLGFRNILTTNAARRTILMISYQFTLDFVSGTDAEASWTGSDALMLME